MGWGNGGSSLLQPLVERRVREPDVEEELGAAFEEGAPVPSVSESLPL